MKAKALFTLTILLFTINSEQLSSCCKINLKAKKLKANTEC